MSRVVVVGSGAAGVHFALTALELGHDVTMLDVGRPRPAAVAPDATFDALKDTLEDPVRYFLGDRAEGVVFPSSAASYYGHPPSKRYVFDVPESYRTQSSNMSPRFSFAQGGLAEAWTGGAYTFNRDDLAPYPVPYEEMARYYDVVAERVGVGAVEDDLARFIPYTPAFRPPLPLDPHSQRLWDRYHRDRAALQRTHGFYLGRSRQATLAAPLGDRKACGQLGRCFWGCPNESIYSPFHTLQACLRHSRFTYQAGVMARWLDFAENGAIRHVVARRIDDGRDVQVDGDVFALAAGALPSSKIVLESRWRVRGEIATMGGLMDNLQVHVPFLTLSALGLPVNTASYQYHHLAFGVTRPDPLDYVHGQITTLKSASVHPIIQSLPFDLRSSLDVFRALRTALAVANVNLADRRRPESLVTLEPRGEDDGALVIRYVADAREPEQMASAVRSVKRALSAMGCFVPPGMTRVLPKGTSVHYAGTMPLSTERAEHHCAPDGRSYAFPNLIMADAATLPFLPAKNHTFMLMVNATRLAHALGPA